MSTRVVVAAVLTLAAAAAADALDDSTGGQRVARASGLRAAPAVPAGFAMRGDFTVAGGYLQTRVLRDGREYLSANAVDVAFPTPHEGPFDITDLAVARDGTLALAVYRFPANHPAHAGIELWRNRRLVGAFTIAPGTASGGLAFSADGTLILLTAIDGDRVAYTRGGQRAL
jgi:hypothetical protein